jgi:hypothetical protein
MSDWQFRKYRRLIRDRFFRVADPNVTLRRTLDPFAVELLEVQGRVGELNDFGDQKREPASFSMFVKMCSPRLWLQTLKIIMITIVAKNRLYLSFKSDLIPGE